MKSSIYGIITISLVFTCISISAPKPAVVPGQGQWTLDTKFTHPEQMVLRRASDNKPVRFWYMILTLTNNTGQDVDFYPKCELTTDNFQIIPAGRDVGSKVFEEIKQRHNKTYPFLELLERTDSKILQGEDNTKDIVVIWPDFNSQANNISIFISGLGNETVEVEHPIDKNEDNGPKKIYLRKTLAIEYSIKGNPASSDGAELEYKKKSWVMR
jgi:hypothetical protein